MKLWKQKKELKEQISSAVNEIKWNWKKRQELLNAGIDYNFLQDLINKCNDNPDLVITIHFKSGDRMVLQTKYQENTSGSFGYDGNPAINELEVK